jgi:GT2 family glycosyltransferase
MGGWLSGVWRRLARVWRAGWARLTPEPATDDPAVRLGLPRTCRLDRRHFDADFYRARNGDLLRPGEDAYDNFVQVGAELGREGRFFDGRHYLRLNRDVARAGLDPQAHYRQLGHAEKRPSPFLTVRFREPPVAQYGAWLAEHRRAIRRRVAAAGPLPDPPRISVIMALVGPADFLDDAVSSVLSQSYPDVELCIAVAASAGEKAGQAARRWAALSPRVKCAVEDVDGRAAAANLALGLATGSWIAFMRPSDELAEGALVRIAQRIAAEPDSVAVYTDHDALAGVGRHDAPSFKPDFNYELLLAQDYVGSLLAVRTDAVRGLNGLRPEVEGAEMTDLLLRLWGRSGAGSMQHIPEVLYHVRGGPDPASANAAAAGVRVREEHVAAIGVPATVSALPSAGTFRVQYALQGAPLVSIIIPTRDGVDLLRRCIDSLLAATRYPHYEIIVADNDSAEAQTLAYFREIETRGVRIVACPGPFNFSRINNRAAAEARGEYLLLLNNDIEVERGEWLAELLRHAQRPDIGCVGARLVYPDRTLQHGGVILGVGTLAGHAHKHLPPGEPGYGGRAVLPQQLSALTAACLMVRRSLFDQVGGLDEALEVNYNDVDFCLRVADAGYRNVWTPYAELIHHESKSRGGLDTPEKKAQMEREGEIMRARWGDRLKQDPFYSPNLTQDEEDFSIRMPQV